MDIKLKEWTVNGNTVKAIQCVVGFSVEDLKKLKNDPKKLKELIETEFSSRKEDTFDYIKKIIKKL